MLVPVKNLPVGASSGLVVRSGVGPRQDEPSTPWRAVCCGWGNRLPFRDAPPMPSRLDAAEGLACSARERRGGHALGPKNAWMALFDR